jgi:hypothetical protein
MLADIAYVPSGENRSHGSSLGNKLRPFCNGTPVGPFHEAGR